MYRINTESLSIIRAVLTKVFSAIPISIFECVLRQIKGIYTAAPHIFPQLKSSKIHCDPEPVRYLTTKAANTTTHRILLQSNGPRPLRSRRRRVFPRDLRATDARPRRGLSTRANSPAAIANKVVGAIAGLPLFSGGRKEAGPRTARGPHPRRGLRSSAVPGIKDSGVA